MEYGSSGRAGDGDSQPGDAADGADARDDGGARGVEAAGDGPGTELPPPARRPDRRAVDWCGDAFALAMVGVRAGLRTTETRDLGGAAFALAPADSVRAGDGAPDAFRAAGRVLRPRTA